MKGHPAMSILAFAAGLVCALTIVKIIAAKVMIKEFPSAHSLPETVDKVVEAAEKQGWVISDTKQLHDSVKKNGGGDLPPITLINICQANHAFSILKHDMNKMMSVMMPCTISVYEKSDGRVFVSTLNAGLLARVYGGVIAEVMGKSVAVEQQKFVDYAVKE
jgi:uncharacterized protein (DUF302 family)